MKRLSFATVLAITALFPYPSSAATSANVNSPLGINLDGVSYYDSEQPFVNIFKTTGITHGTNTIPTGWFTRDRSMKETNEEAYVQLDADGYPTTLKASSSDPSSPQNFDRVCAILLRLPRSNGGTGLPYRPGQYVILYDGSGALQVGIDAKMVSTSQSTSGGRDVFNVANPQSGVWVCITQTDSSNPVRNIRVVKAEEETLLDQGQIFSPTFLGLLKNFRVIRAMQWLKIDASPSPPGNWADRPQLTDAGWGSNAGVPLEVVIDLCNALGSDCWINVPDTADDDYITRMAALVHQDLGSSQKVYVEFSNEVWNPTYKQYHFAAAQGLAAWPQNANQFTANRNWYGMRTAQMCDIWAQAWGSDLPRVHCVLAAQSANTWTVTQSLNCPLWSGAPCYKHHVTDVAIAPYFGWSAQATPSSWRTLDSTTLLDRIFTEFNAGSSGGFINNKWTGFSGGMVQAAANSEAAYQKVLAAYNLPLIAYEGGQSILGSPVYPADSPMVKAYIAANRNSQMAKVYAKALADWKANGGRTYVIYDDINAPSKYGAWGALESFMDTVSPLSSAPPKWQAIQSFIASNPCWWPGCEGTIAEVPLAPPGFHVSN